MKKLLITIILTTIILITATIPVTAADYNFGGANPGNFANPTSVEPETVIGGPADENSNIDRSKDSASTPPSFGSTNSDATETGIPSAPNNSGVIISYDDYYGFPNSSSSSDIPPQMDVSYSSESTNKFTLPDELYYADGSIGTLSIPKINVFGKVYEDESLENLSKGVGHFKFTSCWDGNVGFAAHNRGIAVTFGKIHTLIAGDKIIYTTKLGTRTYEVYSVIKINETDMSKLQRTNENIITLITCVNDIPELRWCVQAREIK